MWGTQSTPQQEGNVQICYEASIPLVPKPDVTGKLPVSVTVMQAKHRHFSMRSHALRGEYIMTNWGLSSEFKAGWTFKNQSPQLTTLTAEKDHLTGCRKQHVLNTETQRLPWVCGGISPPARDARPPAPGRQQDAAASPLVAAERASPCDGGRGRD